MALHTLNPKQEAVVRAVAAGLDAASSLASEWADSSPSRMLIAVSGGADSLALAAGASEVGRRRRLDVRAVSIDHGLQDGSREVAEDAIAQVDRWGVAGTVVSVRVGAKGGLESAARQARYAALETAAQPGEWVLLGHTLDDQAETVLLGLARGSGTRSLAGMPPQRGHFLRPLLGLRRSLVAEAARAWGAAPHDDRHNADRQFARVRVRRDVLPALEQSLGPGVAEALARTARLARADADLLDELAGKVQDPADCAIVASLQPAVASRAVKTWLTEQGAVDLSEAHVTAVLGLVFRWHGQRAVEVPGLTVQRREGRLVVVER